MKKELIEKLVGSFEDRSSCLGGKSAGKKK